MEHWEQWCARKEASEQAAAAAAAHNKHPIKHDTETETE